MAQTPSDIEARCRWWRWPLTLGGALAIAFIAYYTWHEDKLIAFENRIAKAVKGRINSHATGQTKSE